MGAYNQSVWDGYDQSDGRMSNSQIQLQCNNGNVCNTGNTTLTMNTINLFIFAAWEMEQMAHVYNLIKIIKY